MPERMRIGQKPHECIEKRGRLYLFTFERDFFHMDAGVFHVGSHPYVMDRISQKRAWYGTFLPTGLTIPPMRKSNSFGRAAEKAILLCRRFLTQMHSNSIYRTAGDHAELELDSEQTLREYADACSHDEKQAGTWENERQTKIKYLTP